MNHHDGLDVVLKLLYVWYSCKLIIGLDEVVRDR